METNQTENQTENQTAASSGEASTSSNDSNTISAVNQVFTFQDASKKPELSEELAATCRVIFKLSRAARSKEGAAKEKTHYAIAVPKVDFPPMFAVAESLYTEEPKLLACLQAVFESAQDDLITSAMQDAIEAGKSEIAEKDYSIEAIINNTLAERSSNRLRRADIETFSIDIVTPALVTALVSKGFNEERVTTATEAAISWLCKLAAINPALSDKQQDQVAKMLKLEGVADHPMAITLSAKLEALKADAEALVNLL